MTLLIPLLLAVALDGAPPKVLDAATHHLGTPGKPEWDEFAGRPAEGRSLEVRFTAEVNHGEATLSIRQRGVKLPWRVRLNGRDIGGLFVMEEPLVQTIPIPTGALRDGENVLLIASPPGNDDIVVGALTLDPRPLAEALGNAFLEVQVRDPESPSPLPCRITIVDEHGALAALFAPPDPARALRPGVAYTANGQARLGLRPGRYTVYATRGFAYGLARHEVDLEAGRVATVALEIRREVPTPGLVACDTHVHTFTNSGHGDATIAERVVTLAGEGIELPIATDHNYLTDLRPAAAHAGLTGAFTPVIGDEVTTARGHFNAFAFTTAEGPPAYQTDDWPDLIRGIRGGTTNRVVILNHPRDLHGKFRPFDPANFNRVTGTSRSGGEFTFDAVEVINSGAMQSDPLLLFRDWFALWNHGALATAVASSDSHDVSRSIVGQGRTYVACTDTRPDHIDVADACRSFRAGRALVSLGLLADLVVDDRFHVGDLATGLGTTLRVTVRVLGPSWTQADHVALYANGVVMRDTAIEPSSAGGEKARITWEIPRPDHDAALVAIATGPGVTGLYGATPRPYQPSSLYWRPRVLGATNPIRIDGDGDGVYTSPRAQAAAIIARTGTDPVALLPALATVDEALAAQAAELCQASGRNIRDREFARRLAQAPDRVRRGFAAFASTLAPLDATP
jgi:hypothetical protein